MLTRFFDRVTDYFLGYNLHCNIKELEMRVNGFSSEADSKEVKDRVQQLRNFDLYAKIMVRYAPNTINMVLAGKMLYDFAAPDEAFIDPKILCGFCITEGTRFFATLTCELVAFLMNRSLDKGIRGSRE